MPKKDVDVKLNIELGGTGTAALDKLKKALEESKAAEASLKQSGQATALRMETAGQLGAGAIARQMGNVHGFAKGLAGAGMPQMGAAMGKAAGIAGAALAGVDFAANTVTAFNDPYTTNQQSVRSLVKQLPGGETAMKLGDAFSGRSANMALAREFEQQLAVRREVNERQTQFMQSYLPEQRGKEAEAAGMAAASPILMGKQDRMSVTGERQYQERSRLIPVERELVRLKTQESRAAAELAMHQHFYDAQLASTAELQARRGALGVELEKTNSGPERAAITAKIMDVGSQISAGAENQSELQKAVARAREKHAQAQAGVAGGQANILQAEAQNLEARAHATQSVAAGLGAMRPGERMMGVNNLKLLQEHGPDFLSDEQIASARATNPALAQAIITRHGAASEQFADVAAMTESGVEPGGPADAFARAGAKQDQADAAQHVARQTLTAASAAAGKDIGEEVARQLDVIKKEAINAIRLALTQRANYEM